MSRPKIFISYAHIDGLEFTRRLAFALSMYMDVYWDHRLQGGEYPPQLLHEIEEREQFLLVMTPHSVASEWCLKEVAHAELHHKPVTLAMVFLPEETGGADLTSKYIYGSFHSDFEEGFRRITMMMLGSPRSSWEAARYADVQVLLDCLKQGFLPGLIAKEIIDWLMVEKIWTDLEQYILKQEHYVFRGVPRTAWGVIGQAEIARKQFIERNDEVGNHRIGKILDGCKSLIEEIYQITDDEHIRCGDVAYKLYEAAKRILTLFAGAKLDAYAGYYMGQGGYFDFDVAEKLRELISVHARRSRYLY